MRIVIFCLAIIMINGCSPTGGLNLKSPKNIKSKPSVVKVKPPIKKRSQKSSTSARADVAKQLMLMIRQDNAELTKIRRGARIFNGPQRGFGTSLTRNMISGLYGNPYASRQKALMARLRRNVDLLEKLSNREKDRHSCDDLSHLQSLELYMDGHRYLDRDNDGKPCEYIRGKYQY